MKKLIITLGIVAAAVTTHAAAVGWNTGALYNPDASGAWSSVQATATVGTWAATVTFFADNEGVKGDVFAPGGVLSSSTVNGMTHAISGNAGAANPNGFANGTWYWAVLDLSYTAEGQTVAQTLTTTPYRFKTQDTGTTTLNFQTTAHVLDNTVHFTAAVPEPTCGLMLLLGVGLMALKRKRA